MIVLDAGVPLNANKARTSEIEFDDTTTAVKQAAQELPRRPTIGVYSIIDIAFKVFMGFIEVTSCYFAKPERKHDLLDTFGRTLWLDKKLF